MAQRWNIPITAVSSSGQPGEGEGAAFVQAKMGVQASEPLGALPTMHSGSSCSGDAPSSRMLSCC